MQTATNPQTGEKLILQNGQWVPMTGAAPKPAAGPTIVGVKRGPDPMELRRMELSEASNARAAAAAERAAGADERSAAAADRAERAAGRLSVSDTEGIRKKIAAFSKLYGSAKSFQDDYSGFGTRIENAAQGVANVGTPGQRDWWANFRAADNLVRNELFGASLSEGEKSAYGETTITEPMTAEQVKLNVGRRVEEARSELQRYVASLKVAGYDEEQINALLGEYGPVLDQPFSMMGPAASEPASDDEVRKFILQYQGIPPQELREFAKYKLGRDITNLDAVIAELKKSGRLSEQVTSAPGPFMTGVGDLVEGVGDVVGLVANPLNAGINWLTGSNLGTDLGQTAREAVGLGDERNSNPYAKAINQGGAAALTGTGAATAARAAIPTMGRVASSVTDTLAAEPVRQMVAGAGAGVGSEAARQANLGPVGELGAGLMGGMAAYGGANALMRLAQPKTVSPVMEAAQAQGIQLRPADVGGAGMKRMDAAAAQSAFSARSINQAAEATQDGIGRATGRAAQSQGEVLPIDEAGEVVREAGKSYSAAQAQRIGRIYDRAQQRAEGVSIKPVGTLRVIDETLSRLGQLGETNAPLIRNLEKIKADIQNGVRVSGMRDARTTLSQGVYDGKLRSTQEKGIYKQIIDSLSKDIEGGLNASGRRDALNLFKIADKAWSERIDYIDSVLQPVIGGKRSGEQILEAVESMARGKSGGIARLTGLLRELPPEEAGNIRATIIDRLGKATPGQQDADGAAFSANSFLTRWSQMSPKGKAALFGNSELRRNLDQIAKVAEATRETGRYANSSNTGGSLQNNALALGGTAIAGDIALNMGWQSVAALAASQFLTGKLLASPRFTAWLAKVPANPKALERHAGQLEQIAAREPIIANDIASVQQFLTGTSHRAAAMPQDEASPSGEERPRPE